MKFLSVEVENFLSYEQAELSLEGQGLVLIKGDNRDSSVADSNGGGKSAIAVDAWCWILFGRTARGSSGNSVIRRGAPYCKGQLEFQSSSGETYTIIRHQNHPKYKNGLWLRCGAEELTKTDKRETQKEIEKLLGFSMQVALNAMVLGQNSIAFAAMTDAEKKSVFEKVLGFDKFARAQQRARDKAKSLTASVQGRILVIENMGRQLVELEIRLGTQKVSSDEWEEKQAQEKKQLQNKLVELQDSIGDKKREGVIQRQTLSELEQKRGAFNSQSQEWADLQQREQHTCELLTQKISLLGDENVIWATIKERQEDLQRAITRTSGVVKGVRSRYTATLATTVETTCPTCGQSLREESVAAVKEALKLTLEKMACELKQVEAEAFQERERYSLAAIEAETKLLSLDSSVQGIREELTKAKGELQAYTIAITLLQGELNQCELAIEIVKSKLATFEGQIKALEADHANIITELKVVKENPFLVAITTTNQDIASLSAKLLAEEEEVTKVKKEAELYEFWVKGFGRSGIQSYMLDSFTPYLNGQISHYADLLLNGEVIIELRTQRVLADGETLKEDFHVVAENRFGAAEYGNNSGGEKERVDICIALGLQDLVISRQGSDFNLCVLDEVAKYIDEQGVELYYQLLEQLAKERETVLVITHSPHLEVLFDKVWIAQKENGVSALLTEAV